MRQDVHQRSITDAVEFLRAYGSDPALWSSSDPSVGGRKAARRQRQLDRLATEAIRTYAGTPGSR